MIHTLTRSVVFLLIICLASCQKDSNQSSIPTLVVDIDEVSEAKLSDYFESIDYVWLEDESNEDASLGVMHRLILHQDKYYIFDEDMCICFYIFSDKGNFIRKVRGYGDGPGSYVYPSSFQVFQDTLRLLDISQNKILSYDLEGSWLYDAKLKSPALKVFFDTKGNEFHYVASYLSADLMNQVQVYDKHGTLIFDGFPFRSTFEKIKTINREPFLEANDDVVFFEQYADTLFWIKNGFRESYLRFDFLKKGFTESDLIQIKDYEPLEYLDYLNNRMPLYFSGLAIGNQRYFLGYFQYRNNHYLGVYDFEKTSGSVFKSGIINDLDQGKVIHGLSYLNDSSVYTWTTGRDLYKHVQQLRGKMSDKAWETFVKGEGYKLVSTANRAKNSENRVLVILTWK